MISGLSFSLSGRLAGLETSLRFLRYVFQIKNHLRRGMLTPKSFRGGEEAEARTARGE